MLQTGTILQNNDMIARKLFEGIQDFAANSNESRFRVISLPDQLHKLGCSEEGYPKFFLVTSDNAGMMHNLNAELLTVEYNMLCNIVEKDMQIDNQRFTIITLHSNNEQLQIMFVDVFLMMLSMMPKKPSNIAIASKIESLLSIFSKLKRKPVHKLQGLWAELLVIEQSKNPVIVAKAWHSQPESKYDFTMGRDKVEVKSTSSENRIHRFSLDQLNPSDSSRLLICSIIVRESAKDENGLSVFDLYDSISMKIVDSEIRLHVYDVIMETLGSDFYIARKKYFDYSEACDSLNLFEHSDIPKIDKSFIPEHVSEVRFSSDLSHLKDAREKGFNREDSIFFNALY